MAFSQFTTARLDGEKLVVSGPFRFAADEPEAELASLHFVVIQGDVAVHGSGEAKAEAWDGFADGAGELAAGPAQGFGVAVMVTREPPRRVETLTWSDQFEITT